MLGLFSIVGAEKRQSLVFDLHSDCRFATCDGLRILLLHSLLRSGLKPRLVTRKSVSAERKYDAL